jgi:hypothetical protein
MKPEKIMKTFRSRSIDIEGDIKSAIIVLSKLLSEGFTEISTDYNGDDKEWYALKYAEETDEEYEERIKYEEQQRQRTLKYEKEMYEKLKKKFEKGE